MNWWPLWTRASAASAERDGIMSAQNDLVGFPTALATSVGLIMASPVILTAITGFGIGGGAFAGAMFIAFVMMQAQAMTFAEAAAILPTTGSVYDYINAGLGRFWAITGTLSAYILVHVFAGTTVTVLSGTMAAVNFEGINAVLESTGTGWLIGAAMVVVFGFVNAFGIQLFGRIEIVLTIAMWLTLMAFGIAGVAMPASVTLEGWFGSSSIGTSLPAVLSLVGMAMFMFVGFEFVTPLAAEMRNASRHIPRAMALGLLGVAVCMTLFGMAVRRHVENVVIDEQTGTRILDTPFAIPALAQALFGPAGKVWIGIGMLLAGAATLNTLMAGLPRIMYGMAIDGALPRIFAYLHPRLKTPLFGILVAVLIPCVHAAFVKGDIGRMGTLVLAAVCAWGVAYLLVNLSVVLLRIRRPDLPRPYRAPFFPLPQIVSTVGILLAIRYITPLGTSPVPVYYQFGVMIIVVAAYAFVWTKFVQKVAPFRPVPVERILRNEAASGMSEK
jgi:amino acid transporter